MLMKRIGDNKSSSLTPFKRIRSNQPNHDKNAQPPSSSNNAYHQPTLDLSSKDKSIKKELPPIDFTNVSHIYYPVKGLTIEEQKRALSLVESNMDPKSTD